VPSNSIIPKLLGTIDMGRRAKSGIVRRVQLRINSDAIEIFDRYTDTERNEIFNCALKYIYPQMPAPSSCQQLTLIRPLQVVTETICQITIADRTVRLFFPEKLDEFRALAKKFNYIWQGCWERNFNSNIDILDRAAEIGHELVLAGFCIGVNTDTIRQRIVSASFIPEPFKLVDAAQDKTYVDWLTFNYPRGEDWYDEIIKITAARYVDGKIYVPSEHYLEVEDFAEINDFILTTAALEIIDRAKAIRVAAIEIAPRRKQNKTKSKKAHAPTDSIPDHLRDD
jgi:hypothetical protein